MTNPCESGLCEPRCCQELITVCDRCLQASCWQGIFMCWEYKTAGITKMTRAELADLDREHPSYWKTDKEIAEQ